MSFFSKQFIDVIHWTEPEPGILAYRFPMEDMEIQNGGQLTVRDSQAGRFRQRRPDRRRLRARALHA